MTVTPGNAEIIYFESFRLREFSKFKVTDCEHAIYHRNHEMEKGIDRVLAREDVSSDQG